MKTNTIHATATFNDPYAGETPVHLVAYSTSRRGKRLVAYRWTPAITGHRPQLSVERAIAVARLDRRFSNVNVQ